MCLSWLSGRSLPTLGGGAAWRWVTASGVARAGPGLFPGLSARHLRPLRRAAPQTFRSDRSGKQPRERKRRMVPSSEESE